jgi:hypothetical protein
MKNLLFVPVLIALLFMCSCGQGKTDLPMSATQQVDTNGGFQFAFHYEKEEPVFEFISPGGIIYKEGSEDLTVERQTQPGDFESIYFLFEKGEIGEWTINYDKFTNESVDFYYHAR